MIAFIISLLPHMLQLLQYGFSYYDDSPVIYNILFIVCVTFYQVNIKKILDNADGKQARKTNNSSTLGLLFDHGADCINTGLSFITYCQIIGVRGLFLFNTLTMLMVVFWAVTFEEYYFGSLDFPIINVVNEGTFSMCLILIPGIFYGNHIYRIPFLLGFNFVEIMYYSLSLVGVIVIIIPNLIKCSHKKDWKSVKSDSRLLKITFIVLLIIPNTSSNTFFLLKPKLYQYLITFSLSKIIISLMICHIMDSPIYNKQLPIFYLIIALLLTFIFDITKLADDITVFGLYFCIVTAFTVYFSLYCVGVVRLIAKNLNIHIFKLKKNNVE